MPVKTIRKALKEGTKLSRRATALLRPGRLRQQTRPGMAPGTLQIDPEQQAPAMDVIAFDGAKMVERPVASVEEIAGLREEWPVVWLNVVGLGDASIIKALGREFGVHRLTLEDIVHTHQRPKAEFFGNHYYVVSYMLGLSEGLDMEQVSLLFGKGWVLTFQERPGDCFEPVRGRIRSSGGVIRGSGSDYMAYALIDVLVDNFFPILERYGDRFETIEERIMASASMELLPEIRLVKRELGLLRRLVWPQRDALNTLIREPGDLIAPETAVHLRDCVDHATQLMDLVETFRELAGGLMDMHMSMVSHRMNKVVQLLTIVTTIFIPLSFLTGLYGMNFERENAPWNLPELGYAYGYPALWGVMLLISAGLLWFFWRRGWFSMG